MGVAIGAPKRKRTRRTPEQAEVPADGGLMEIEEEAMTIREVRLLVDKALAVERASVDEILKSECPKCQDLEYAMKGLSEQLDQLSRDSVRVYREHSELQAEVERQRRMLYDKEQQIAALEQDAREMDVMRRRGE